MGWLGRVSTEAGLVVVVGRISEKMTCDGQILMSTVRYKELKNLTSLPFPLIQISNYLLEYVVLRT